MFELPTTRESPRTGARYVQALSMTVDQLDLKTGTQVRTEAMEYVLGRAPQVTTAEVDGLARLALNEAARFPEPRRCAEQLRALQQCHHHSVEALAQSTSAQTGASRLQA
ncbi:hypothetical protein [Deinococcus sp. SL84]|uniref:hypothetical protein n=1 Tax=Deinococcus sp. SL84 TaxID=2994663 RepID=UPI0022729611|nr:hypothetical protein [Deinococcus sp. SL84]MCY1703840.1 hypothetical protein [Deinococcus sp. SL84]